MRVLDITISKTTTYRHCEPFYRLKGLERRGSLRRLPQLFGAKTHSKASQRRSFTLFRDILTYVSTQNSRYIKPSIYFLNFCITLLANTKSSNSFTPEFMISSLVPSHNFLPSYRNIIFSPIPITEFIS
jgi:hypothetical protein